MVNNWFNGVKPVDPVDALAKEPATKDCDQGKGRGRSRGRGHGRVASTASEIPNDNVPLNGNPSTHNEDIEEEVESEDVEEIEKRKECRMKRLVSHPSMQCYIHILYHY